MTVGRGVILESCVDERCEAVAYRGERSFLNQLFPAIVQK